MNCKKNLYSINFGYRNSNLIIIEDTENAFWFHSICFGLQQLYWGTFSSSDEAENKEETADKPEEQKSDKKDDNRDKDRKYREREKGRSSRRGRSRSRSTDRYRRR